MPETPQSTRLVMSVPEAGAKLGMGRNAAYAAAAKGDIPTIKVGGRIFVPIAAFERLLDIPAQRRASA